MKWLKAAILFISVAIILSAFGLAYCEDKATQHNVLQVQAFNVQAHIDELEGVIRGVTNRITDLKMTQRDIAAKLQALKTVEVDTTKPIPAPPKDMGKIK